MTNIYEQHEKAFSQVSGYVLMRDGVQIGTIAIKYPKDGAGRLWAYFHIYGHEMARDYAGGYGYDKRSAAIQGAIRKHAAQAPDDVNVSTLLNAASAMRAGDWQRDLENNGFTTLRAI